MGVSISVIVPVFNGENHIDTCIESLQSQRFRDFEVIFVDDGSTDGTQTRLRQYTQERPEQYRLFRQVHDGVSAARNTGLAQAQGKYIAFVDVDDELDPDYLDCLYGHMENREDRVTVSGQAKVRMEFDRASITARTCSGTDLLEQFLYGRIHTGVCGMLIPRSLMEDHGLLFRGGYRYSEDMHMVWRLFSFAGDAVIIDAPLYIYRETPGSAMTTMNASRLDSMKLIGELEEFFAAQKPEFAPKFQKYAVNRIAWSLLWQAAHYLDYKQFREFLELYDFRGSVKGLLDFPDLRVVLSSGCFLVSKRIYHGVVSGITRSYRRS